MKPKLFIEQITQSSSRPKEMPQECTWYDILSISVNVKSTFKVFLRN